MSMNKLNSLITNFNNNIANRGLNGYLRLLESGDKYKLVMGSMEQFTYNVYQCVLYEGSLNECYKVAQAIRLAINVECGIY